MNESREGRTSVYEIGYLLAGIPEERVEAEASALKEIVTKHGGAIIADENPRFEKLAYTMRKKSVSGAYQKYDEAYFGWVKFEAGNEKIDGIKKAIETVPAVLRILVITTVRESTYLGKRASQIAAAFPRKGAGELEPRDGAAAAKKEAPAAAPATIEEMDKSIDEMVKEV